MSARRAPHAVQASRPRTVVPGMSDHRIRLARAAAAQLLLTLDSDKPERHTLADAIERYRSEHLLVDGIAQNTIAWSERALLVLGRWGKRPIDGRWRDVAGTIYREAREAGLKEATPSLTVNRLARVLNLAKSWGWRTEDHDLHGLCRVRSGKSTRVLVLGERMGLNRALDELDTERSSVAASCVRFLLHTGWRVSEAASMEWLNVAPDLCSVFLPSTKAGPQTRAIGAAASEVLRLRSRAGRWVFPARRAEKPIGRRSVEDAMQRACALAGIRGASCHALRHTRATVAAQLQLPTTSVSLALGHTVEYQTAEYQHVELDDVRAAASAVDSAMLSERKAVSRG